MNEILALVRRAEDNNITQKDLHEESGVAESTISYAKKGGYTSSTLEKLNKALDSLLERQRNAG